MTKREKVLKKIGGLMTKWGVSAEELADFNKELDTEIVDEDFVDDEEKVEEIEKTEEFVEEPKEEKEFVEEPEEEKVETDSKYEEAMKTIEGLTARIESLEEIVSKLGTKEEEQPFGVDPQAESSKDDSRDYFETINKKRTGNY